MDQIKLVAICQSGGEFTTNSDGTLSYSGGEAHAIDVDREMKLQDLKSEIANMFSGDTSAFIIKYLLPSNRRTLITISNDKDLQRMVDFSAGSITIDVFLVSKLDKKTTRSITAANEASPAALPVAAAAPVVAVAPVVAAAPVAAAAAVAEMIPFATPESAKRQKVSDEWELLISGVGQSFDSVRDFRDALHKHAIAKGFMYKFIKNDGNRVTAECTAKDCPWRIHASTTSPKHRVVIKTLNDAHTCEGSARKDGHRLANQKWVASIIKDKLKESPLYKPKDIANDFQRDYGLNLNYTQAWRGKYLATKELINSDEAVCSQLPWFCERILETNPGSVATLVTTESRFERLFVAFHASLHGFEQGCRPLLFLNGISLKVNRQWKLLAATSVDAESEIFPVAFAIVLLENEDNWKWFLEQLKSVLSVSRTITFISNRENGLAEAVPQVFEDSFHGRCLSHLVEEFKEKLEELIADESLAEEVKDAMVENIQRAARSYKVDDFNECMESIRTVSKEAADWVLDSNPELWSNASFKGLRYDNFSSNVSELFNAWLGKVGRQEPSVIQIVDWVRCKVMEMMYLRRESSNAWSEILTPLADQKLQQETAKSGSLEVISSGGSSVYEVRDHSVNVVNIETWECTCRKWQVTGIPCSHAISVSGHARTSVFDYCSKYFTTECYRLTYSLSINPIPDAGRPLSVDSPDSAVKYPLRTARRPGRPKQSPSDPQRIISKRTVKCGKCKEYGHNKATCKVTP